MKEVINAKTNYVNIIRIDNILERLLERTNVLESKIEYNKPVTIINNGGATAQEAIDNTIGGWTDLTPETPIKELMNNCNEFQFYGSDNNWISTEIYNYSELINKLENGYLKYRYRIKEEKEPIKPPLGLTPKNIYYVDRYNEVGNAIKRYIDDNKDIPYEWTDEYNDLKYIINPID